MLTRIAHYEIVTTLGSGGGPPQMYLARDPRTDRLVAIKTYVDAPDEVRERFAREAELQSRVRHPNVVQAIEAGVADGSAFVVTEYVRGEPLAALLRRTPPVPLGDRLAWIEQLLAGLEAIHAAGIVHGAITPGKLLVADTSDPHARRPADKHRSIGGTLRIAGFEMARLAAAAGEPPRAAPTASTAPEQLEGRPIDFRSDLFAAGAVLYETIALSPPFAPDRRSPQEPPVPLSSHVSDLDPELARIVARALEHAPDRRYQSAGDLRRDLENLRFRLRLGAPAVDFMLAGGARAPDIRPTEPPAAGPPPRPAPAPAQSAQPAAAPQPDGVLGEILSRKEESPTAGRGGLVAVFSKTAPTAAAKVDDIQFTVYRPRAMRPATRRPLLVFTHLGDARDPESQRPPIERVRKRAATLLGPAASAFRDSTTDARHAVPAGGEITLLPDVPGITFRPERHVFRWEHDIHEHRFEMEAERHSDGQVVRGQLTAYLGVMLLAEVPLAIRIDSTLADESVDAEERTTARAYRKIFASYSRKDVGIVEQFERYVEALGDQYLRDVRNLRAGERWEDGLRRLIEEADVFQLFWSWNAMRSPNVRQEWEYALSLGRPAFVRPTYWETPLPESSAEGLPPEPLRQLHFHRLGISPAVDTGLRGGASVDDDSGVVRRREMEEALERATSPSGPVAHAPAGRDRPTTVPTAMPGPGRGPSQPAPYAPPAPNAGRSAPLGRVRQFVGIAAGIVLAAITGTLVWQNTVPQETPPTVTAEAPPSSSASDANPAPPTGAADPSGQVSPLPPPPVQPNPTPQPQPAPPPQGRPTAPSANAEAPPVIVTPPPPPLPPAIPRDSDAAAIRAVLTQFEQAYAARDASRVRSVWPSAPSSIDAALASARNYQVDILNPQISIDGDTATVTGTRRVRMQPASGGPVQEITTGTTFRLQRAQSGWFIVDVR